MFEDRAVALLHIDERHEPVDKSESEFTGGRAFAPAAVVSAADINAADPAPTPAIDERPSASPLIATLPVTRWANLPMPASTWVRSSISLTLGANVENLLLTVTGNLNGTGTGTGNSLTVKAGANVLTDGGNDTLSGAAGCRHDPVVRQAHGHGKLRFNIRKYAPSQAG